MKKIRILEEFQEYMLQKKKKEQELKQNQLEKLARKKKREEEEMNKTKIKEDIIKKEINKKHLKENIINEEINKKELKEKKKTEYSIKNMLPIDNEQLFLVNISLDKIKKNIKEDFFQSLSENIKSEKIMNKILKKILKEYFLYAKNDEKKELELKIKATINENNKLLILFNVKNLKLNKKTFLKHYLGAVFLKLKKIIYTKAKRKYIFNLYLESKEENNYKKLNYLLVNIINDAIKMVFIEKTMEIQNFSSIQDFSYDNLNISLIDIFPDSTVTITSPMERDFEKLLKNEKLFESI